MPEAEVTGIEISESQLARARQSSLPNLSFIQGDARRLPFDAESFDVVYCRWVLEHLSEPKSVLSEILRVLRPGGRFFSDEVDVSSQRYDPPVTNFEAAWRAVTDLQRTLGGDNLIGRRLRRLLMAAGFTEVVASAEPAVYQSGTSEFSTWVDNERAIIEGCAGELKTHGLATDEEIAAAFTELDELKLRNDATSWYCWFRASGRKPA
jgi:SAM-dependent methyltransferase